MFVIDSLVYACHVHFTNSHSYMNVYDFVDYFKSTHRKKRILEIEAIHQITFQLRRVEDCQWWCLYFCAVQFTLFRLITIRTVYILKKIKKIHSTQIFSSSDSQPNVLTVQETIQNPGQDNHSNCKLQIPPRFFCREQPMSP